MYSSACQSKANRGHPVVVTSTRFKCIARRRDYCDTFAPELRRELFFRLTKAVSTRGAILRQPGQALTLGSVA